MTVQLGKECWMRGRGRVMKGQGGKGASRGAGREGG